MHSEIKRQMQRGGMIDTAEERERFFRYMDVLAPRSEPLLVLGGSRRRREFTARCLHHFGPGREGGHFHLFEPSTGRSPTEAAGMLESLWRKSLGGTLFVDRYDEAAGSLARAVSGICRQAGLSGTEKAQPALPALSVRLVLGRVVEPGPEPSQRSATASRLENVVAPITVDMRRIPADAASGAARPDRVGGTTPAVEHEPPPSPWRDDLEGWLSRIWMEGGSRQGRGLLRQLKEWADQELAEIALSEAGGNRRRAAEILGISSATLSRRLTSKP